MHEIVWPWQIFPNNFKKLFIKLLTSIVEKYATILQNKELHANCENVCFFYGLEKRK